MASEVSQVNGIEPDKAGITEKLISSPVKSISAVINDSAKHKETTRSENGTSNHIEHDSAETNGNADSAHEKKTVEPKAVVIEPEVATTATPVATIEPMETDQLSTPPEKVSEKTDATTAAAPAADVTDSKPVEETAEKAVDDPAKSDEKSTTEEVVAEKPADEAAPSSPKKPGRKPAGRKPATPKKTSTDAPETTKSPEKQEEPMETSEEAASAEPTEATPTSAKKTPRKKRESAAADADGDKTPLLEAPLVIEGKRSRQKTDRLDSTALNVDKREKELNPSEGSGLKLGEIPFIESMISKTSPGDLKTLHRIAFGKVGAANEVKKHLRQFNGFNFAADSKEYEKKRKSIENIVMTDIKLVCSILGLERSGKKDELLDAIMEFCLKPSNSGKKPAVKSASAKKGKRKAGPGRKKKNAESGTEEDEVSTEAEEKEEEEEEKEEEEEVAQPSPKRGRPSKASTSPAVAKATPAKRAFSASPARSAKKPAFPTDSDIKSTIKDLLKGVNLEEVTMKEMTAKVYEKYPGTDLTSKKDFIKDAVKSLLSSTD